MGSIYTPTRLFLIFAMIFPSILCFDDELPGPFGVFLPSRTSTSPTATFQVSNNETRTNTTPFELDDKFDQILATSDVRRITNQTNIDRNEKCVHLLNYLDKSTQYDLFDKYELVDMYEKMIVIQNKVKDFLSNAEVRQKILKKEIFIRKELDETIGRRAKLNFIEENLEGTFYSSNNHYVYLYFYFDIDWQDTYQTVTISPARKAFIEHYFPHNVIVILNAQGLGMDEKLASIDYNIHGKKRIDENEKKLMEHLYLTYLVNGYI